ncbi:hypothetical protein [Streptomyces sp. WM6378]|uniref:hypothetical protein n=1 Tax=Streptomyces sp. WM6378 TaxID=1415557 RepID=UPI0018FF0DA4|nr:hypothetical protein [Streptomyces sp. WM6378]
MIGSLRLQRSLSPGADQRNPCRRPGPIAGLRNVEREMILPTDQAVETVQEAAHRLGGHHHADELGTHSGPAHTREADH